MSKKAKITLQDSHLDRVCMHVTRSASRIAWPLTDEPSFWWASGGLSEASFCRALSAVNIKNVHQSYPIGPSADLLLLRTAHLKHSQRNHMEQMARLECTSAVLARNSDLIACSLSAQFHIKNHATSKRKDFASFTRNATCGSRIRCMLTLNPFENRRFETLSYVPPLTSEQIAKQVEYIVAKGWIPCLEFDKLGAVFRENSRSCGYYDGRYWTMWKLPMFGCMDAAAVLREIEECKATFPDAFIRLMAFDNRRQVQCAGFLVQRPPSSATKG